MKKVLMVGDHGWDYELCAFEEAGVGLDELAKLIQDNNGDYEDEENCFGAKFIEFDAELTENDVEIINSFLDGHESKLFLVEL